MADDYVEVSPQSWEYRLVAAVVRSVEQRAGAGSSRAGTRWNGRLLEENDPDNLGTAHGDGSLSLSVPQVLDRLREARDLDRPLTEDEVWLLRDAMTTVTHEAAHLMSPLGDNMAPEAYPYDQAASAFDEGRIEHWTETNLDDVIQDVFPEAGLKHRTAAVLSESSLSAYPACTAAVRHLDEALGARSGLTSEQITGRLLVTDDAQRWNVAVDVVIDERLARTGLMPEADRAEVRKQLVAPLRESFGRVAVVEADESLDEDQKAAAGIKAAETAIAGLDTELQRIERGYRGNDAVWLRGLTGPQAGAAGAAGRWRDAGGSGDGARVRGQQVDRAQPSKPRPGRGW